VKINPHQKIGMKKIFVLTLIALAPLCLTRFALGSSLYSGSISGVFTNPVFSGIVIDVNGNPFTLDETGTAVYSGMGSNLIHWGTGVPATGNSLEFDGATFSNVAAGQQFLLGTLTYFNGSVEHPIFGATLTLSVSPSSLAISPAVAQGTFVSTVNGNLSPRQDADYLSFDVFPVTFNVYEQHSATADIFGEIVGDPRLQINTIQLAPGQGQNGFLGHGRPSSVPDTGSTFGLLSFALAALIVGARRLRSIRLA
jgi:protein with PEP-CTERM/exosortase system signal